MDTEDGTLKRAASVDEVARVVEFLATDLGAFVSGYAHRRSVSPAQASTSDRPADASREVIKVDGAMAML